MQGRNLDQVKRLTEIGCETTVQQGRAQFSTEAAQSFTPSPSGTTRDRLIEQRKQLLEETAALQEKLQEEELKAECLQLQSKKRVLQERLNKQSRTRRSSVSAGASEGPQSPGAWNAGASADQKPAGVWNAGAWNAGASADQKPAGAWGLSHFTGASTAPQSTGVNAGQQFAGESKDQKPARAWKPPQPAGEWESLQPAGAWELQQSTGAYAGQQFAGESEDQKPARAWKPPQPAGEWESLQPAGAWNAGAYAGQQYAEVSEDQKPAGPWSAGASTYPQSPRTWGLPQFTGVYAGQPSAVASADQEPAGEWGLPQFTGVYTGQPSAVASADQEPARAWNPPQSVGEWESPQPAGASADQEPARAYKKPQMQASLNRKLRQRKQQWGKNDPAIGCQDPPIGLDFLLAAAEKKPRREVKRPNPEKAASSEEVGLHPLITLAYEYFSSNTTKEFRQTAPEELKDFKQTVFVEVSEETLKTIFDNIKMAAKTDKSLATEIRKRKPPFNLEYLLKEQKVYADSLQDNPVTYSPLLDNHGEKQACSITECGPRRFAYNNSPINEPDYPFGLDAYILHAFLEASLEARAAGSSEASVARAARPSTEASAASAARAALITPAIPQIGMKSFAQNTSDMKTALKRKYPDFKKTMKQIRRAAKGSKLDLNAIASLSKDFCSVSIGTKLEEQACRNCLESYIKQNQPSIDPQLLKTEIDEHMSEAEDFPTNIFLIKINVRINGTDTDVFFELKSGNPQWSYMLQKGGREPKFPTQGNYFIATQDNSIYRYSPEDVGVYYKLGSYKNATQLEEEARAQAAAGGASVQVGQSEDRKHHPSDANPRDAECFPESGDSGANYFMSDQERQERQERQELQALQVELDLKDLVPNTRSQSRAAEAAGKASVTAAPTPYQEQFQPLAAATDVGFERGVASHSIPHYPFSDEELNRQIDSFLENPSEHQIQLPENGSNKIYNSLKYLVDRLVTSQCNGAFIHLLKSPNKIIKSEKDCVQIYHNTCDEAVEKAFPLIPGDEYFLAIEYGKDTIATMNFKMDAEKTEITHASVDKGGIRRKVFNDYKTDGKYQNVTAQFRKSAK